MRFAWSFSKIKNFETCPLRHYELDLRKPKKYVEPESEPLRWGNAVHAAFETALKNNTNLPKEMEPYQHWLDQFRAGPGETLIESKMALTKDLEPCEYFGPRVWVRMRVDFLRVNGAVAAALDWKTGKKDKADSGQLMLTARAIFSYFPEVQKVQATYVWLQDDCTSTEYYDRDTINNEWLGMLGRVQEYATAVSGNNFPAKPGGLCYQYCPVANCEHHGKRRRN